MRKIKMLLVILGFVFISSCIREEEYLVEYRVYGGGSYYEIFYRNYQGVIEQSVGHVGNWSYKFKVYGDPLFEASVEAYNFNGSFIKVEIWVNGKLRKSSGSHRVGDFAVASASCYVSDKFHENEMIEEKEF